MNVKQRIRGRNQMGNQSRVKSRSNKFDEYECGQTFVKSHSNLSQISSLKALNLSQISQTSLKSLSNMALLLSE